MIVSLTALIIVLDVITVTTYMSLLYVFIPFHFQTTYTPTLHVTFQRLRALSGMAAQRGAEGLSLRFLTVSLVPWHDLDTNLGPFAWFCIS